MCYNIRDEAKQYVCSLHTLKEKKGLIVYMNFKKIVSIVAVAAVCVTMLSGCYAPEDLTSSYYEMSIDTTLSASASSSLPTSKYTASIAGTFEGWIVSDSEGALLNITNGTASVLVVKLAETTTGTMDEALTLMKTDIDEIYTNVVYSNEGSDTTIDGRAAKRVDFVGDHRGLYTGKTNELSIANQTNSFFAIVIDNEIYVVKSNVPTLNIAELKTTVEEIFKDIKFSPVA